MENIFKPNKDISVIKLIPYIPVNISYIYNLIYLPIFKTGDFVRLKNGNKNTYKVLSYKYVGIGGNKILVVPIDMPDIECQLHYAALFELDTSYYRKLKIQNLLINV